MRTTYLLLTTAAAVAAAVTVYAQLPNLDTPPLPVVAGNSCPAPNCGVPRLELPQVTLPPEDRDVLGIPPLPTTSTSPALPALPEPPRLPASASVPALPNTPVVPPAPPSSPLPASVPAVPVPALTPSLPSAPSLPSTPAVPSAPELPKYPPPLVSDPPVEPLPLPTPTPKPKPATTPVLPTPPAPTPVLQPPVAPNANIAKTGIGQFVVLRDDKLIEGTVTMNGETVVVRQGALDRPFTKSQVQFVAESRDEVYKFMLAKVPANDAVARLKVARWCVFSGMREQALTEAREIQKLQPNNVGAAELIRAIEQSLQQFPPANAPKMGAPAEPVFPTTLSTKPLQPVLEPEPDITPEAIKAFPTRVQPFLANQCVDCHAKPDYEGKFKLAYVKPNEATQQATRANLRAVVEQLRKDEPVTSPLLVKTLTAHGGQTRAAVAGRNAVAYQTLEAWTALALSSPIMPTPGVPPPSPMPLPSYPVIPPKPVATEPATPILPPAIPPVSEPVLPPLETPLPIPVTTPAPLPIPPAVPVPSVPPIPPSDPLLPVPVPPATAPLPKPTVPAIPPASALPLPVPPATPFGTATPPKPPVTGPTGGDEFDPAGFNETAPKK